MSAKDQTIRGLLPVGPLHAFRAVMRLGSMTAAGSALGLSQPAVSQQIARLEDTLGLTLFFRIRGQLMPTASAEHLLEEVERTLQSVDRLANSAENIRHHTEGRLKIATSGDIAQTILAEAIAVFGAEHPGVRFQIATSNQVIVTEMVASRQAELGMSRWAVEQTGCQVELAYTSPIVCVLPRNHKLCELATITPRDLDHEPVILVCRRIETRMRIAQVFREWDARLTLRAETHSAAVALQLVARGLGILLFERCFASYFEGTEVALRRFEPLLRREGVVIVPKDCPTSELSRGFIATLTTVIASRAELCAVPALTS